MCGSSLSAGLAYNMFLPHAAPVGSQAVPPAHSSSHPQQKSELRVWDSCPLVNIPPLALALGELSASS